MLQWFWSIIFQLLTQNSTLGTAKLLSDEWQKNLTNEKLTLVQVIAWCCKAASHTWANVDPDLYRHMALNPNELLSHTSLGWLYVFSSFPPPPPPQWLLLLSSKPFELDLRYLGQRKYGSGKMYWVTLTQGHGCDIDKQKFACLQGKVRTIQPITTKLCSYIPLVMVITWLDFGGILLEIIFLPNFLRKFRMCFFKVKHFIGHISGMDGPIDAKRKGGASVGYWVNYVTLTFDLTHDLDLWFFKVKFQNSFLWGIVIWLMWNKKKANQLDTGLTVWSCTLTTPMTLTL